MQNSFDWFLFLTHHYQVTLRNPVVLLAENEFLGPEITEFKEIPITEFHQ